MQVGDLSGYRSESVIFDGVSRLTAVLTGVPSLPGCMADFSKAARFDDWCRQTACGGDGERRYVRSTFHQPKGIELKGELIGHDRRVEMNGAWRNISVSIQSQVRENRAFPGAWVEEILAEGGNLSNQRRSLS